jgi:RNA polymerase sigma factor (sigma-70 family)
MNTNELLLKHKGLVFMQMHKFNLVDKAEAESQAFEALYDAIKTYDSTKDIAFSTYASVCIFNRLGSYSRMCAKQRQIMYVSYDAFIDADQELPYYNVLCTQIDTEENCIYKENNKVIRDTFNKQYNLLKSDRHKSIIKTWFELDFVGTTTEIAKKVGVSQSYVSQVINNFKFILRKELKGVL